MITALEIKSRAPLVGGAVLGEAGAYERIDAVAFGELDPGHSANRCIALLDKAPRTARGSVEYRCDVTLLQPVDQAKGNGRLLYEVNNRGRMMLIPNLCAGTAGNQPKSVADLGNALPFRLGFTLAWSGWDAGAPRANGGLALDAPTATYAGAPIVQRVREEFVSGTRLGVMETIRLSYEATDTEARLTMRRTQTAPRQPVDFVFTDPRTIRLLPEGTSPEQGVIYELVYNATKPRVLGIGFAATRDLVSHLRHHGAALIGRSLTHTLGFGISQAGRYLRDHIALGFNKDENGRRVFDGVFTHVAGIGRLFFNTPFAQPARTRTWHEDHAFPEVVFPFSTATFTDPISGATASLLRGDGSDPFVIETNTATEYWQKGASLLHTNPEGTRDAVLPDTVRGYFLSGTNHTGRAGVPRDAGPCQFPRNAHDPMAAVRALLVALDEWVTTGRPPPPSRLPRIDDGTLVEAEKTAFPSIPGFRAPRTANNVVPLSDWTSPGPEGTGWPALVPQVGPDGNELAGL
ncbi:MAG: alpha/beta hydrolase domain-containing protein, partial [Alphaproteobacteria bacterium]|nr:alpha/beta hydrolase domain-containing protein [Alphaproteobacteria bacterium]